MGACTMAMLRLLPFLLPLVVLVLLGNSALAQSPTYGVGRTPTEEEIRAWDISISPTGEELPPGSGTPTDGALVYRRTGCIACHGATATGGSAPTLVKRAAEPNADPWALGRILPIRAPYATTVWDYINRGMPIDGEGTLTADEVYALTAYLLYINVCHLGGHRARRPESAEDRDAESRCIRAPTGLEARYAKADRLSPLRAATFRSSFVSLARYMQRDTRTAKALLRPCLGRSSSALPMQEDRCHLRERALLDSDGTP